MSESQICDYDKTMSLSNKLQFTLTVSHETMLQRVTSVCENTIIYWQNGPELVLTDFALYVTHSLSSHWLRLLIHIIYTFIIYN